MINDEMENIKHKIIMDITLLEPYINKKPAITSKLTIRGKESIKKMSYQPDEKEVFAEAGIRLVETVDIRIVRSTTIDCDGVTLTKTNDKQFRAETPKYQTPELANREAVNMIDTIMAFMESQGNRVDTILKTKCKSGKIEVQGQKENVTGWCETA